MTSIWAFLNQTLAVTVIAVLLFLIKGIFRDKLSPRWQYGVLSVLVIRAILPVNIQKSMILPIAVWTEHLKGMVEKTLDSVYAAVYEPAYVKHILPVILGKPESIMDWIFVVYVAGVAAVLGKYIFSYLHLRKLLKYGTPVSKEMENKISFVSKKYNLKTCKAVMMDGLTFAFVCGGIHPVLVLPKGEDIDEKVILHELLHLKYHDELQSIGWCMLRALHWCNPFLHWVFNEITNEMEALCDQRVLERLEGEERREYGGILLSMANDKYARVPGTTSISNGGKNIAKRIASIVRFKQYPRGMALVSICITLLLAIPCAFGTEYVFAQERYGPHLLSDWNFSMAMARVNRCSTPAGALNTYADAILRENEIMLATALSLEEHNVLDEFHLEGTHPIWATYGLGEQLHVYAASWSSGYSIWNVEKINEKLYRAFIIYSITTSDGVRGTTSLIIPVEICYEDAWVVKESGERTICYEPMEWTVYPGRGLHALKQYKATGETGEVTIKLWTINGIDNGVDLGSDNLLNIYNATVKLDAEFSSVDVRTFAEYSFKDAENRPEDFYGIIYRGMEKEGKIPEFEKTYVGSGDGGGNAGDIGETWAGQKVPDGDTLVLTGLGTYYDGKDTYLKTKANPVSYAVRIFWDGKQVEELIADPIEVDTDHLISGDIYGQGQRAIRLEPSYMTAFAAEKKMIPLKEEYQLETEEIYDLIEEILFERE